MRSGFKLATVFGEIAADLAVCGETKHHITHLDLTRLVDTAAGATPA